MILSKIVLHQFRNREKGVYTLDPQTTVIVGENARGKTNLLESIYFLINGVGFRESKEEELIRMGESQSVVEGRFSEKKHTFDFRVQLKNTHGVIEKVYFIQKIKKRHAQYIESQTKAILFAPEQIEIITGSPDTRRSYLNRQISLYDLEYKKRVVNLESALRKRNKILEHVFDPAKLHEELQFWNTYIIEQSIYITKKRQEYIDFINAHPSLDSKQFKVVYKKNEATNERFAEVHEKELRIRKTYIGPQKDDIEIYMITPEFEKNVEHYGSRSEQRLAVFWLKMNEIWYFEDLYKKKPILLLDDVFSEFDQNNKHLIIDLIRKHQTVLTTTERDILKYIKGGEVIEV